MMGFGREVIMMKVVVVGEETVEVVVVVAMERECQICSKS